METALHQPYRVATPLGSPDEALRDLRKRYAQEVHAAYVDHDWRTRLRQRLREPRVLGTLIIVLGTIITFIPGLIEGLLQDGTVRQAIVYTIGTTPLSGTWEHVDLNPLLAAIRAADGSELLANLREVAPHYKLELRALFFEAFLVVGAVATVERLRSLGSEKQQRILDGTEFIERPHEQTILLAGEGSFTCEALLALLGEEALPIVERKEAMARTFNRIARGKSPLRVNRRGEPQVPVYLNLDFRGDMDYMSASGWQQLKLSPANLLRTTDGRHVLLTFGLGETNQEPVPLADEVKQDLTVAELIEGSGKLVELARQRDIQVDAVIKVYLGNARLQRMRHTGGGMRAVADRQAARGVDIYVDTRAPVIRAIADRLGERRVFAFETGTTHYVPTMIKAAAPLGITVYSEAAPPEDLRTAICIVYEQDVSETIETVKALRQEYGRVIALTPTLEGHERAVQEEIESICIALVFAEIVLEIRRRVRLGESATAIQADLDRRYPSEGAA
jgi:hypothetical protein